MHKKAAKKAAWNLWSDAEAWKRFQLGASPMQIKRFLEDPEGYMARRMERTALYIEIGPITHRAGDLERMFANQAPMPPKGTPERDDLDARAQRGRDLMKEAIDRALAVLAEEGQGQAK